MYYFSCWDGSIICEILHSAVIYTGQRLIALDPELQVFESYSHLFPAFGISSACSFVTSQEITGPR